MTTVDENEQFAGNEFTPFHDGDTPRTEKASNLRINITQGYDTRAIDKFRQGVSIRTSKDVYGSTQPKIWAGNLNHYVKVTTYGQARDFTEFENDPKFEELPKFNPAWYITASSSSIVGGNIVRMSTYPFPIVFNDGPQQEEEASIEPFIIPFRKAYPYGNYFPRSIKANLEDGNNFDNLDGGTTRIEQFIEYDIPTTPRFFLDEGVEYFGPALPTGELLTTRYNPIALYQFNGNTLDSSGNSYDLSLGTGIEQYTPGPVPGTQAVLFDSLTAYSSSIIPELHLSKSMTVEMVINIDPVVGGNTRLLAVMGGDLSSTTESENILFSIGNNGNDSFGNGNLKSFRFGYDSGSVGAAASNDTGITDIDFKNWFHIVLTRNSASNSTFYVNGTVVSNFSHPGFPAAASSVAFLQVGGGYASSAWQPSLAFSGSLSSLKLLDRELTQAEVIEEFKLALPYASGETNRLLQSSIVIDGYTTSNQRNVVPFNDIGDEQIVDQITKISSPYNDTFRKELIKLKFGLDEDVRGSFDRKSAAAGSVVYGRDAARYGTDSIAYVGVSRD